MNSLSNFSNKYKQIFNSFFILFIFVAIAKLLGLIKEIYFAKTYGVSIDVDFYFFYLSIFGWPAAIILSVFSAIFIPVIANLDGEKRDVFIGELTGNTIVFSILLLIFFAFFSDFFIGLFPYNDLLDDVSISYSYLVFIIPIFLLISLFSVLIMSSGDKTNTLLEGLPALFLLIYFLFSMSKNLDDLIIATIVAFVIQTISLVTFWKFKNKNIPLKFSFSSESWKSSLNNFTIIILSTLLLSTVSLLDQFFSVNLSEESVSLLNYANKLILVIFGIGAVVIQRTFLPDFSIMQKNDNLRLGDALNWFLIVFLLSLFITLCLAFFAETILSAIFLRGDFSEQDLLAIIPVFQFGLIQIPFYFSSLVLVQYYLVKKHIYVVAISGVIAFFVKIPLNIYFLDVFDLKGINLATSAMYFISFLILSLYLFKANQMKNASS